MNMNFLHYCHTSLLKLSVSYITQVTLCNGIQFVPADQVFASVFHKYTLMSVSIPKAACRLGRIYFEEGPGLHDIIIPFSVVHIGN